MILGRIGLSARLSVTILLILAVSITVCFTVVYRNVSAVTGDAALREVEETTRTVATHVEEELEVDLQLARDLATHAAVLVQGGVTDRAVHGAVAKGTLEANPDILAAWYAWEPNALDGRDADFVGAAGHDSTGRFVPYYNRGQGSIALEPLVDYTVPGAGDYYLVPMKRANETLVEPYLYSVNGAPTLMTSIVVPILVDGTPRGVGGVDVALGPLSEELGRIRPLETGVIGLLSAKGAWLAHPEANLVTQPVATKDPAIAALLTSLDASGTAQMTGSSSLVGEESFISLRRIEIGRTGDALYLVTAIPTRTVWKWADWSLVLLGVSALALMGVASVGCWLVLRAWLSRPLGALIGSVDQITAGQLDQDVPFKDRQDEMGALSRALDVFRQNAQALREADARGEQEARRQTEVVDALARGLNRLAEGDLTASIPGAFDPRYEKLRQDYNATVASLRDSMVALERAGEQIGSGAGAIEQAVSDLSRRTEDQAATLEETSAAFGQITESVRDTARNADQANGLAAETRTDVHRSGIVVTEAVSSMDAILDSSRKISQIIGVIDDIAFQTNLLALNAGVEAARAGESGRGFAVVASEVRALAQRAADAAHQVKELITESSTHVERGVERVGAAGTSLGEIVGKVETVASLISEIAVGAKEQYSNLAEVTHSVARMDSVTQQNAAMAEETSAAATSLAANGRELRELIGRFDTGATFGRPRGVRGGGAVDAAPGRAA